MTTGHFGLAVGVKAGAPRVPLWALFVASYLLDFVFIGLVAGGIESFAPMNPGHPAYGQVIIHAYYSHSLVGAVLIAGIAALIALPIWGKRNSVVIGAVVLSHWVLDLVVHRHDLPILPGNAGNLPMLGLGLWSHPVISAVVELAICATGVVLYVRATQKATRNDAKQRDRRRGVVSSVVAAALLLMLAISDFLAMSTFVGILIMLLLIALSGWLDHRAGWRVTVSVSSRAVAE